jgi:magnesium transporter
MLKKYELLDGRISESTNGNANILVFFEPSDDEKKFLTETLQIDEHNLLSALTPMNFHA